MTRRWLRPAAIAAFLLVVGAVAALDVPHAFTAGEVISAQEMNENFAALGAAIAHLAAHTAPDPLPAAIVRRSDQPTQNPVPTPVVFDEVILDTGGLFDVGTPSVLRSTAAGLYMINVHASWASNDAGSRTIIVAHGGSSVLGTSVRAAATGQTRLALTGLLVLEADEPVTVSVLHNAGAVGTVLEVTTRTDLVWLGHLPLP